MIILVTHCYWEGNTHTTQKRVRFKRQSVWSRDWCPVICSKLHFDEVTQKSRTFQLYNTSLLYDIILLQRVSEKGFIEFIQSSVTIYSFFFLLLLETSLKLRAQRKLKYRFRWLQTRFVSLFCQICFYIEAEFLDLFVLFPFDHDFFIFYIILKIMQASSWNMKIIS